MSAGERAGVFQLVCARFGKVTDNARFQVMCSVRAVEVFSQGEISEDVLIEVSSGTYITY